MKSENKSKRKKILKIIKRTIISLVIIGAVISTFPSIEYDNAYLKYKKNLPVKLSCESQKDYVARLFKEAIMHNNKLNDNEKTKIIDSFNRLVIDNIGEYFSQEVIVKMMAVASTESIRELNGLEKKFGWYSGTYNSYLNHIIIDESLDEVDEVLLAHEQLHAIIRNGFYLKAYALNEAITKNSVSGDSSYIYLDKYYDILCFVVGKEKLLDYYLSGDLDGLKNELSKYISVDDVNKLIVSSDDLVFSSFYTSFLYRIGINHNSNIFSNEFKKQDESTSASDEILTKLYEKKFNCTLAASPLGKVLFGKYISDARGLTYIDGTYGYYEPICSLEYMNTDQVKLVITLLTSNINKSTGAFYSISEEYIVDMDDFATINLQNYINDVEKKHKNELNEKKSQLF